MESKLSKYFSSHSHELMSKMQRLDYLIGRDHWLSVGNYKEELLRSLLRNLLPRKYEVSTGFILALNKEGEEIKSKQQDIIIWDSSEYSAIFRDGDFVIIPPESCKAVIEVKSTLDSYKIKKSMLSSDNLFEFLNTPSLYEFKISKYIFSFGSDLKFPYGFFDAIVDFYDNDIDGQLSTSQRQEYTKKYWPQSPSGEMFTIDGFFCLGKGAILRETLYDKDQGVRFIFKSYELNSDNDDHVYKFFEHIINSEINSPRGRSGLYYSKQPGLFSLMSELSLIPPKKGGTMVYPYKKNVSLISDNDSYIKSIHNT